MANEFRIKNGIVIGSGDNDTSDSVAINYITSAFGGGHPENTIVTETGVDSFVSAEIDNLNIDDKADKVSSATEDDIATLDIDGNLKDGGTKLSDLATKSELNAGLDTKEDDLGVPAENGFVLTGGTDGSRIWSHLSHNALSDRGMPDQHNISSVTNLQSELDGKKDDFTEHTGFNKDYGTSSGTVAVGNHLHTGTYEPANSNIQTHISDTTNNPHSVTKTMVGLGSVDNTSDADKPVSTATQTALNLKQDKFSPEFGNAGQVLTTNASIDGYEWTDKAASGGGDMLKSEYATNGATGIVDESVKVNNHTVDIDVPSDAVFTDTTYIVGDGGLTEKNFTTGDKTKLDSLSPQTFLHADLTDTNTDGHPIDAITDLQDELDAKEDILSKPIEDGAILSSMIDGTRSWKSIVGGTNVTVDNTDTANITISSTGGTTAGIITRGYYTGDTTDLNGTTYYQLKTDKGTVDDVVEQISISGGTDAPQTDFNRKILGVAHTEDYVIDIGNYTGNLTVSTNTNNGDLRFQVHVYKANGTDGTYDPIADLIAVADTGIIDIARNKETPLPYTAHVDTAVTITSSDIVIYVVSGGATAGNHTLKWYLGKLRDNYIDVPKKVDTDTVINKSNVVGATASDAFNKLASDMPNIPDNFYIVNNSTELLDALSSNTQGFKYIVVASEITIPDALPLKGKCYVYGHKIIYTGGTISGDASKNLYAFNTWYIDGTISIANTDLYFTELDGSPSFSGSSYNVFYEYCPISCSGSVQQYWNNTNKSTGGSGGGQVEEVVAGTNISVDSSDPTKPEVSVTGMDTAQWNASKLQGSDLDPTTIGSPSDDQVIMYTGGKWQAGFVPIDLSTHSIDGLNDVDTTTKTPELGQTLAWDGTNWVPFILPQSSAITIQDPIGGGASGGGDNIPIGVMDLPVTFTKIIAHSVGCDVEFSINNLFNAPVEIAADDQKVWTDDSADPDFKIDNPEVSAGTLIKFLVETATLAPSVTNYLNITLVYKIG